MGRSRSLSPARGLYNGGSIALKAQHHPPPKVSHLLRGLPVPQPSCTLQDLCSEDKQKVAGLLKQVDLTLSGRSDGKPLSCHSDTGSDLRI